MLPHPCETRTQYLALFSIIFMLLISGKTTAQNTDRFADTTATWQFLVTQHSMVSPTITKYTEHYWVEGKDTILGQPYEVVQSDENGTIRVRQDSTGKVYFLNSQQEEHLVFDFGLAKDDTFHFDHQAEYSLLVDSVDTVQWGGAKKRMYLSCISGDCNMVDTAEVWVEGVGFLNLMWSFHPFERTVVSDGPSLELLCYSANNSVYYQNPEYNTCQHDTVINSVEDRPAGNLSVYPNPGHRVLNVSLSVPSSHLQSVSLMNMTGQEVLAKQFAATTKRASLHTQHLPPGIYLCSITLRNGDRFKRKVVIE